MKRIISMAVLALTISTGSAMADGYRGHRNHANHLPVIHHQARAQHDYRFVDRRPIYVNNNRYVFSGGYSRPYVRPVIQYRYTNLRQRPQLLVENYENVTGYVWIAGQWQWDGYEWNWIAGHYQVDPSYQPAYSNYETPCN